MATIAQILVKKWPGALWAINGDDYNQLTWYPGNVVAKPSESEIRAFDAEVSLELRWDIVRDKRNILLSDCDWTQLTDAPLTTEIKATWSTYRQLLRDVPQQPVEPEVVIWPTQP